MSGNEARVQAIHEIVNRKPISVSAPEPNSEIWASDVFNLAKMEKALPKAAFIAIRNTIHTSAKLEHEVADLVATALKDWALLNCGPCPSIRKCCLSSSSNAAIKKAPDPGAFFELLS